MPNSALLWCFAARRSVQAMALVLVKHCNAAVGHHRNTRRVGLSAFMTVLRLLLRTMAINCETRLILNADRPTELGIITLKEYLVSPQQLLPGHIVQGLHVFRQCWQLLFDQRVI